MPKKYKMALVSAATIIFLIVCVSGALLVNHYKTNDIKLIYESIIIEYGEIYNPTVDELIDLDKYNIDRDKIFIESNLQIESGRGFPAVGEYTITINYKKQQLVQKVIVQDTISPEVEVPELVELEYGTDLSTYDFKVLIKAIDMAELKEYVFDTANVDPNVSGEYTVKVLIEDVNGNKTEKEFTVLIKEEIKQEESTVAANSTVTNSNENTNTNKSSQSSSSNSNNNSSSNSSQSSSSTSNNSQTKPEEPVRCTTNNNHGIGVGTSKDGPTGWFNSKADAIAEYNSKVKYWSDLWKKNNIDIATYDKNCPSGYQVYSCMFCGKWTIDYYYYSDED